VINQTAAEHYFAGRDPIGREFRFWGQARRIVGVVGNERFFGLTSDAPPAAYISAWQAPPAGGVLLARTSGPTAGAAQALRRAIRTADPDLAVFGAEPFAAAASRSLADRRFAATLIGLFAAVTIVLALIGIHGVISYTTAQRSQEIGIRVALGATREQVAGMVLRGGLRLALVGTTLGLAGAVVAGRLLGRFLFGVGQLDALTFTLVPALVLAATALAVLIPARRAARAEPIDALRGAAQP
jgi:ABC-type antimicrobial peptide transport system permease subunit